MPEVRRQCGTAIQTRERQPAANLMSARARTVWARAQRRTRPGLRAPRDTGKPFACLVQVTFILIVEPFLQLATPGHLAPQASSNPPLAPTLPTESAHLALR